MICQVCGVEAPTRYVAFYQNIGALVMRFSKSIEGNLCKSCIHKYFWEFTTINFFLGWWGMISIVVTPFFIINNVGRYLFCLGMQPVQEGATAPRLTDDAIGRLKPYTRQIFDRIGEKESLDSVAEDIAALAGVTPGQVHLWIHAVFHNPKLLGDDGRFIMEWLRSKPSN
jgi:hypothetical protein